MAFRTQVCVVAVCDLCGGSEYMSEYTPHYDSKQAAIADLTGNGDDGWTLTHDGQLVCDSTEDTAHEDAHAEAGKRMSRSAATWTPDLIDAA